MKRLRRSIVLLILNGLLASMTSARPTIPRSQASSRPDVALQIETSPGNPDGTGIAPIMVSWTLSFSQPVQTSSLESLVLLANAADISRLAPFPAGWTIVDARTWRRTIPLADILKAGVKPQGDQSLIVFNARVKLKLIPPRQSTVTFSLLESREIIPAGKPEGTPPPIPYSYVEAPVAAQAQEALSTFGRSIVYLERKDPSDPSLIRAIYEDFGGEFWEVELIWDPAASFLDFSDVTAVSRGKDRAAVDAVIQDYRKK